MEVNVSSKKGNKRRSYIQCFAKTLRDWLKLFL